MRFKTLLLTMLAFCFAFSAKAQIESGKVYRFVNKADTNIAMASVSTTETFGVKKTDGDFSQLWLIETHPNTTAAWSLRSLGNGLYLTPTGTSQGWTFADQPSNATILYCINTSGNYYTFEPNNNAGSGNCMHYATSQGGKVVGWNTGADATHWTIEEVTLSEEEIEANWKELDDFNNMLTAEYLENCKTTLSNLFEDDACTTLRKDFADVAAMEADADYQALPATLKNMVKKVYTGDWSEENYDSQKAGWDSDRAKRFRVQAIEPYSIAGEITSWLGINAHANMDNPTGLFANDRQHIFVMVEGEIKNGAELFLGSMVGHSLLATYENGIRLHEGLNIVPFNGNGNALYINYVVHTYASGLANKFPYKLSDYPQLKIHIEGGNINGYYNAVGDHLWGEPDDDNDWLYYEERANLDNITILGKHQILQFCLNETTYSETNDNGTVSYYTEKGMAYYLPERVQVPAGTPENQKVNTMVEAWDRIHMSELITMGLLSKEQVDSVNALYPRYNENWEKAGNVYDVDEEFYEFQEGRDYSEYFNHHGIAYGNFSGYMSGGWRNCNYHHNTMGSIIGEIAVNAGSTWGPAHEIGHQHQSAMNLNGLTEVTNNLFSNVAVWYMGMGTSRINATEGNLAHIYDAFTTGDFFNNNIWALTHMYYRLWLYYHLAGHNTKFFPRLYEMLRKEPMTRIYYCEGNNTILRFYKHACVAAGEDLTEFFRAHGFFVPMESRFVGDYANSEYTQTQEDIDAAIAWVKALGLKENIAPLFINDCVATPSYGHDGKTQRSYWDGETVNGLNAELGMYTDCINTSVKAEGYYYKRNGFSFSFIEQENAKGAIGFVIYSDDELIAFTNNHAVNIPTKTGTKALQIYAVQADGTKAELLSSAEAGTEEEQLAALNAQLTAASEYIGAIAEDNSNTGFYYKEEAAKFLETYNAATEAKNNADQSVHTYGKWAVLLENEIQNLISAEYSYIHIRENNFYTLSNRSRSNYALTLEDNVLTGTTKTQTALTDETKMWEFISTGVAGEYYIRNKGGKYITDVVSNGQVRASSTDEEDAVTFIVTHISVGSYDIVNKLDNTGMAFNNTDKKVKGGEAQKAASRWTLTVIEDNVSATEKAELESLISNAERILSIVCDTESLPEVVLNEGVLSVKENLKELTTNLNTAKVAAEENIETAYDYYRYINELQIALNEIDGAYAAVPKTSTADNITWYYIRNVESGKFCSVDMVSTSGANKRAVTLDEIEGKENERNYWWYLQATENEGEYIIVNGAEENAVYSTKTFGLKADGSKEGAAWVLTPESNGFTIGADGKYWTNATYTKIGSIATHWIFQEILINETGIEEVLGETQNTPNGIYDMYGRKIEEISQPGIYIVNGKKVIIK